MNALLAAKACMAFHRNITTFPQASVIPVLLLVRDRVRPQTSMIPSDFFRENLTCRVKHNHGLLVRVDDELKRLQERRADLEEQNHLLFAVLKNSSEQIKAPRTTTNLR